MKKSTEAKEIPVADPDLKARAKELVAAVEAKRAGRTIYLGKLVKTIPTTDEILAADPRLQVAFVQQVVATYAELGAKHYKGDTQWFHKENVPSGGAEVVRLLLRRRLPFADEMLAEIFEKLAGIHYLSLVEFNEQLAAHVEKRTGEKPLSPRLRKAMKHFADVLMYNHVSKEQARFFREEWGFPRALDRKIADRLERVLAGPTTLN